MNEVVEFAREGFGRIRTIERNGNVLFCGKDIAVSLGYSNSRDALAKHCKSDGVAFYYPISDSLGRKQNVRFITEGDVYRLVTHSKLSEAQRFESWVYDEILPSIRRKGKYDIRDSKIRIKSKEVRRKFTDDLKDRGYTKPHEYIRTTMDMKNTLGIKHKKSEMDDIELKKITAVEALSDLLLTDEYGFAEVNPVCIDASSEVERLVEEKKRKSISA